MKSTKKTKVKATKAVKSKSNKRNQINYNKVVNIAEDGEITTLDYTFKHGDGFKGAVGSKFYPISRERYEDAIELDNLIEYLEDIGLELRPDQMREGYRGLAEDMINLGEAGDFMFDQSGSELWGELRKATGLNEEQAYIFECVGGGRCFDNKFQGNVNPKLSRIIREYESE